ncbi:MAG: hypothetical protein NZT61_04255 [Deltaproteobacteria bacterium]|nr:hypothetical protein [Deltaproteobacteria bacterium]MCX7952465.1 hypothetical protein [Deltaproteobacteria bacterium]
MLRYCLGLITLNIAIADNKIKELSFVFTNLALKASRVVLKNTQPEVIFRKYRIGEIASGARFAIRPKSGHLIKQVFNIYASQLRKKCLLTASINNFIICHSYGSVRKITFRKHFIEIVEFKLSY